MNALKTSLYLSWSVNFKDSLYWIKSSYKITKFYVDTWNTKKKKIVTIFDIKKKSYDNKCSTIVQLKRNQTLNKLGAIASLFAWPIIDFNAMEKNL